MHIKFAVVIKMIIGWYIDYVTMPWKYYVFVLNMCYADKWKCNNVMFITGCVIVEFIANVNLYRWIEP